MQFNKTDVVNNVFTCLTSNCKKSELDRRKWFPIIIQHLQINFIELDEKQNTLSLASCRNWTMVIFFYVTLIVVRKLMVAVKNWCQVCNQWKSWFKKVTYWSVFFQRLIMLYTWQWNQEITSIGSTTRTAQWWIVIKKRNIESVCETISATSRLNHQYWVNN